MIMENDYVLVTGASSGIGQCIAKTLATSYPLILCGRSSEGLEETRRLLSEARGADGADIVWQYDLSDTMGINAALTDLLKNHGAKVQGFVHAAGISPIAPLRMLKTDVMRDIMNVNFFAAAEILKVLSHKRTNGRTLTRVVFISSLNSRVGARGHSIYCASKGALDSFMRSMAEELAPQVRVNSIRPGRIENTHMTETGSEAFTERPLSDGYLLGAGHKQDIADMAEFLLSAKSRWITGQVFTVDGGRTAH